MKKLILAVIIITFSACNKSQKKTENAVQDAVSVDTGIKEETKIRGGANVRNKRYCEILVVKGKLINLTATVYNTLGCNECPQEKWNAINVKKLKDSLNAKSILMNGPRVFMMDKIGQTNTAPPKINLGGIEMIERAKLTISMATVLAGKAKPYEENTINRSTEYVFLKGKKIYKITSPNHTYIMQSYSLIVDKNLNEEELENLDTKINLPSGWEYKVETIAEDLILKTIEGGEAHVIQDDLQNSYQRMD